MRRAQLFDQFQRDSINRGNGNTLHTAKIDGAHAQAAGAALNRVPDHPGIRAERTRGVEIG